ncbi:ubiquitin carboxyl-terminal hydrolase [Aspergillus luchuensis]|uniref:Ubiquitin carboxyl-terminal hydrolase n=1 Tax=Aspergillus kawachii TaxID=1069201 RepID=A0A146F061_ASPKA|nr:ubiquitin carboxyl-terminal hydrolase [Aspergillus luchuensis]
MRPFQTQASLQNRNELVSVAIALILAHKILKFHHPVRVVATVEQAQVYLGINKETKIVFNMISTYPSTWLFRAASDTSFWSTWQGNCSIVSYRKPDLIQPE